MEIFRLPTEYLSSQACCSLGQHGWGHPNVSSYEWVRLCMKASHQWSVVWWMHQCCLAYQESVLMKQERVQVGVKTIKRLISGNIGKDGTIYIDAFQAAILQYRNTPDPTTRMSPAMCLFGRPVRDLIPILPGKYNPHNTWRESLNLREEALRHPPGEVERTYQDHSPGDRVRIQNQTGPHPNKWDMTGIVIEVRQFHQYLIRIDGSGRQTLRNRKFLRKFIPMYHPPKRRSILEDISCFPPNPSPAHGDTTIPPSLSIPDPNPTPTDSPHNNIDPTPPATPAKSPHCGVDQTVPAIPARSDTGDTPQSPTTTLPVPSHSPPSMVTMFTPALAPTTNPTMVPEPLRRSTRIRKPPDRFMWANQPSTICRSIGWRLRGR